MFGLKIWSKKKKKKKKVDENLYLCDFCFKPFKEEELSLCSFCEQKLCIKCIDPLKHDCPDTNFEVGMQINAIIEDGKKTNKERERAGIKIFNKAIENAALEIEDCIKDFDLIMEEQLGLKSAKSKGTFIRFSRMLLTASTKRIRDLKRD